jgi:hypothetical protein
MLDVILSEAKDLTVGMSPYCDRFKMNEAKMVECSLKILPASERSLAPLGMTVI